MNDKKRKELSNPPPKEIDPPFMQNIKRSMNYTSWTK
jgi:hypothetical protein